MGRAAPIATEIRFVEVALCQMPIRVNVLVVYWCVNVLQINGGFNIHYQMNVVSKQISMFVILKVNSRIYENIIKMMDAPYNWIHVLFACILRMTLFM